MSNCLKSGAALLLAAVLALQPLSALACTVPDGVTLSENDQERMVDFFRSRSQGLAETLIAPSYNERVDVHALFAQGDGYIDAIADGDYLCRTVKLGGAISPLVVYPYFDCRISKGGTRIDKITVSQGFSGRLQSAETAVFYWGALYYGDEQPIAYGADADRDQVGCIYRVPDKTAKRYRLELPYPRYESTHDVIELVRKD